jgi:peptidyl-prolyl cis-trans isomerase A (cyclophilin A)
MPAVVAMIIATSLALVASASWTAAADERAPERFRVRLDTTRGAIVIDCTRAWAPRGADRFYTLVTSGYYDDAAFFRVVKGKWAQFGIAGTPALAQAWRGRSIPDDPFVGQSNVKGTVAFAFASANGRTTQVFFNLVDNSPTHDKEPFVVFGRVVDGLDVMDALYDGYGEAALGGIRAGNQDPLFIQGNAYLRTNFPRLDYIRSARVE